MEALRITFRLATPMVAPTHPIHLDALLAWAAVEKAGGDIAAQEWLPLAIHGDREGGPWCWQASQVIPREVVTRDQLPMTRAFDPWTWADDRDKRFQGGPKTLKPGTGPYKAHQLRLPLQQALSAVAWAVGDVHHIRDLLDRVESLGKLARIGCGEIAAVTVEPDPLARERWRLRTMPTPTDGYRRTMATVRPPYWRRAGRIEAWSPPAETVAQAAAESLRGVG